MESGKDRRAELSKLIKSEAYADLATLCFRTAAGFGGSTLATREGATPRLLITVFAPSTELPSAAARAREPSFSTCRSE
jgi:hypothetical protein